MTWGLRCYHPHRAGWGYSHMERGVKEFQAGLFAAIVPWYSLHFMIHQFNTWVEYGRIIFADMCLLSLCWYSSFKVCEGDTAGSHINVPVVCCSERSYAWTQVPYIIDTLEAERIAAFPAWHFAAYPWDMWVRRKKNWGIRYSQVLMGKGRFKW